MATISLGVLGGIGGIIPVTLPCASKSGLSANPLEGVNPATFKIKLLCILYFSPGDWDFAASNIERTDCWQSNRFEITSPFT